MGEMAPRTGGSADGWADGWWTAADGTRLHYRDYPGAAGRTPLLCLPGLTRNARDFAGVAERHAGERRVIVVELRGRGQSGYAADALSYVPATYVDDVLGLVDALGIDRLIAVGTSLGGLLTMMLALARRPLLAGALLNDIGPVLEPAGLARIGGYVGRSVQWPTWLHAARALAETHAPAYPRYALEEWTAMAHRLCRLTDQGRVVLDYDLRIAEPFRQPPPAEPVDLWPGLEALAGMPVTLIRGAVTDLLSKATAAEMARRVPGLELVTVPDVGHAPTLDEPACVAAIARLVARADPG